MSPRHLLFILAMACAILITGCDDENPSTADAGTDTAIADTGSEDTGTPDTGTLDTGDEDAGTDLLDVEQDTGPNPDDRDGDFIPNSRDNCPDLPNSNQSDADLDGLGDVCDACPEIWDPTNGDVACQPIAEEEPNDFVNMAELTLPFTVTGTINEYTSNNAPLGDTDVFTFEAQAGQLLRLDLDVRESECFCVLQVESLSGPSIIRVLIAQNGTKDSREFFVPFTGQYYLFFYDLLNAQSVPGQVGGPDRTYSASVYEVPIEPLEQEGFPIAYSGGNDKRVRFTKTRMPSDRIIRAQAASTPLVDNSSHPPALVVWDPVIKSTVAFAEPDDTTSNDVRLVSPPTPSGEVLLVEDFVITWQVNTVTVVAELEEALGELEPNNVSSSPSPIATNTPARGSMGSAGDTDYFVFAAPAAKRLRITVAGSGGFAPDIALGSTARGFFSTLQSSDDRGGLIDYLTAGPETLVLRVRDANRLSGPDVKYTVEVAVSDPAPTALGAPPLDEDAVFDPRGAHLLYEVNLPANTPQEIVLTGANYSGAELIRVVDPSTGELVASGEGSSLAVSSPVDRNVLVDLGVKNSDGGPTATVNVSIDALAVTPITSPFSDTLTALDPGNVSYYSLTVADGELLSLFTADRSISVDLTVLDAGTFEALASRTFASYLFYANDTGAEKPVIIALRNRSSTAGDATLSIQTAVPAELGSLPATHTGESLQAPLTAQFYWMDLDVGDFVQVGASGTTLVPRVSLLRDTLTSRLKDVNNLPALYVSPVAQRVLVEVRDSTGGGGSGYDFDLSVELLEPATTSLPINEAGVLDEATQRRVFKLTLNEGEVLDVDFEHPSMGGVLYQQIEMRDAADGRAIFNEIGASGMGRYNLESGEAYLIVQDFNGTTSDSYDYTLDVQQLAPTVVGEATGDNDTLGTAQSLTDTPPLRVTGRLTSGDVDVYAITLQAGQKIRAYTTWSQALPQTEYTELTLFEDGVQVARDSFGGENSFSGYVEFTNTSSGALDYQLEVDMVLNASSLPYSLVIFVE